MANSALTHGISDVYIAIYHPVLLSLILVTSGQSNNRKKNRNKFCQSVQICRREKEKVENNDNCKTFCVTRKRNNRWRRLKGLLINRIKYQLRKIDQIKRDQIIRNSDHINLLFPILKDDCRACQVCFTFYNYTFRSTPSSQIFSDTSG